MPQGIACNSDVIIYWNSAVDSTIVALHTWPQAARWCYQEMYLIKPKRNKIGAN